jgi:UDP-N-acetylmuramoyl-tripeptide--D-alanyl-D-alanine ligase
LDLVVGVRGHAVHLATAACAGGVAALFLSSTDEAGKWLKQALSPGDTVLIKGSRGVHMERVLERLRETAAAGRPDGELQQP